MNSFNLSEAFGEVSEQFVAEELDAGAMIPQEELITEPSGREHIMMTENIEKKSRSLWLRGGIAAAIVGVLIAGNLAVIYGLGRIGKNGSSVVTSTTSTEEITDTTCGTELTETTSTTLVKEKVTVPNFIGKAWDEAIKLAHSCGLYLDTTETFDSAPEGTVFAQSVAPDETVDKGSFIPVNVSKGEEMIIRHYCFDRNGKPVTELDWAEYDGEGWNVISDGTDQFQPKGNSLYRLRDNQMILTLNNPLQYMFVGDEFSNEEVEVIYERITAVGSDWYLIDVWLHIDDGSGIDDYACFWVNRKTGKSTQASFRVKTSEFEIDPNNHNDDDDWILARDDGSGYIKITTGFNRDSVLYPSPDEDVFYVIYEDSYILKVPAPGHGDIKVIKTRKSPLDSVYNDSVYNIVPLRNGIILLSCSRLQDRMEDEGRNNDVTNRILLELNLKEGCVKELQKAKWFNMNLVGGKIICWLIDDQHEKLAEYLPENNSFKTIAILDDYRDGEMITSNVCSDAVIIQSPSESIMNEKPDLLVSIIDGKITELPIVKSKVTSNE